MRLGPSTDLERRKRLEGADPSGPVELAVPPHAEAQLSGEAGDRGTALEVRRRLEHPLDGLAVAHGVRARTPPDVRALIADLAAELRGLREVLEDSVRPEDGPLEDEIAVLAALRASEQRYRDINVELHEACRGMDLPTREATRRLALREVMPLVDRSPFFHRARAKPRGVARDHVLLNYVFTGGLRGPTRFDRYLHALALRSELAVGLRTRERLLRARLIDRLARPQPHRIVSVGAGPAVEIIEALKQAPLPRAPVEVVLVDGDAEALTGAVRETQELIKRIGPHVTHVMVRGLCVEPLTDPERWTPLGGTTWLDGFFDVILCPTLLDDMDDSTARPLLNVLGQRLSPGGILLVGALRQPSDTAWMLEYVMSWPLCARQPDDLLRLAQTIDVPGGIASLEEGPHKEALTLSVERRERPRQVEPPLSPVV